VLEGVINTKPRLHPKTLWWAYLLRGQFHLRLRRPGRAIKDIEYAMRYASRRVENYFWAAKARLALEDFSGAEREVEKALVISPGYGRAYLLRASIREKQGRFQEVVDDYRTVQERFPFLFERRAEGRRGGSASMRRLLVTLALISVMADLVAAADAAGLERCLKTTTAQGLIKKEDWSYTEGKLFDYAECSDLRSSRSLCDYFREDPFRTTRRPRP